MTVRCSDAEVLSGKEYKEWVLGGFRRIAVERRDLRVA